MWVWVVIVLCGAGGVAGLYMALRGWLARETRLAGAFVLLCLLVTPAPVPDYAGSYAPALIVLIFEGAFQRGGDPFTALRILLAVAAVAVGIALLTVLAWRRLARRAVEDAADADSSQ